MRWDEHLLYAASGLYERVKEAIIDRAGKDELPSERSYRLKYHLPVRFTPYGQPEARDALFSSCTVQHAGESCLVMLPGFTHFFALGSLFAPAFSNARLRQFYEILQLADSMTARRKA